MILGAHIANVEKIDGIAALKKIERIGRICYQSQESITDDSWRAFIEKLLRRRHLSVIEHVSVTAYIYCDRGVSHELVRHRIASFSQESTRYCNYNKGRKMPGGEIGVVPMMDGLTDVQKVRRRGLYAACEDVYNSEVAEGVSPQQARDSLPTCLRTEIVMTCNLREWLHFFEMRCAPNAHPAMRKIAFELLDQMQKMIPVIFDDISVKYARLPDSD